MKDCLFCRIVRGEIPSEFLYQGKHVLAFRDIAPQAPVHLLIIPRTHLASLADCGPDEGEMLAELAVAARELAEREGVFASGYRLVTNIGAGAGQSVFHLHFHLLGGRHLAWPPG